MTICAECRHARDDQTASSPTWAWKCAARVPRASELSRDRLTGKPVVGSFPLCVDRNRGPDDCLDFAPRGTTIDDFATIISEEPTSIATPWLLEVSLAFLGGMAVCGLILWRAGGCVP